MSLRVVILGAALVACGGGSGVAATAAVGPARVREANPVALQKMLEGATAAREPKLLARGLELLREAVRLDPELGEARYDLGVALAMSGDLAAAADELEAAQKRIPDDERTALALAETRRRLGAPKDAADGLEPFVKAHPQAEAAQRALVVVLREAGQGDRALVHARELVVKRNGDGAALAELALCHLAKGERETAELLVKQAVETSPKSAAVHRASGFVRLAAGDDAVAFQDFGRAAQEDPKDTTSRLVMGGVLVRAGAYARAVEQYRAALAVAPDDVGAQIGLAVALRAESQNKAGPLVDEARRLYERVLEREPRNLAALYDLGVLHADALRAPKAAKPYFEKFLDAAPKNHPARGEAERYVSGANAPAAPAAGGAP